jgi:WhiB family redox-sensing transcriptional regulator
MSGGNGGHNRQNPALTNAQVGQAVHDYRSGRSAADIAAELGVTEAAIQYHLRKRGVPPRKAPAPRTGQVSAASVTRAVRSLAEAPAPGAVLAALVRPSAAWQEEALCSQTDPESFFPDKGGSTKAAKAVCARCPVRAECLEHALAHEERFGVWGGLSERERYRLAARRRGAA